MGRPVCYAAPPPSSPVTPMHGIMMKVALAILVVLMAAVFFWRPLSMVMSDVRVTNDFVLQTAEGALDSKGLRGKVLAIIFGYAGCGEACAGRMGQFAKAYEMLSASERSQVKPILISVDPERDTPARIKQYAAGIHADLTGATGKAEEIKAVADAFAADYRKFESQAGDYAIQVSALTYVVDADGRFVAVLNESTSPEKVAAALRARLPGLLPPR